MSSKTQYEERKAKGLKTAVFWLDSKRKEQMRVLAAFEGMSMNKYFMKLIDDAVEAHKKSKKKVF